MFNFRLQRILELREKAEQAKARELASAQGAADVARRDRDALADLNASSRAEVDAAHRTEPRVGHLQQLGLVLNALDQRLESAGDTMRAANDIVDDAQKLLDAASRDRRVLDRLKVRHTDQWRVEEAHKDRIGMDEVALTRFTRNAEARSTNEAETRSRTNDELRESTRNDGATT